MVFLYSSAVVTHSEKILLMITSKRSLVHTPATKLNPPSRPLFKLCLTIVKITGPTDKARKKPNKKPFTSASVIEEGVMPSPAFCESDECYEFYLSSPTPLGSGSGGSITFCPLLIFHCLFPVSLALRL